MLPNKFFDKLLEFEGTYSNDPSDPGKETIYGVSSKYEPIEFEKIKKLYFEKKYDEAKEIAKGVYDLNYYRKSTAMILHQISQELSHQIFDCSVNMGLTTSTMMLQRALNQCNGSKLEVDGDFGQKSLDELNKVKDLKLLNNTIVDIRVKNYNDLVVKNVKLKKFINGWLKRAEYFRMK